jgi:hypothetical protein
MSWKLSCTVLKTSRLWRHSWFSLTYPAETLRPTALSPCRYGRLSLRITYRWSGQFTSLESVAQHWAL